MISERSERLLRDLARKRQMNDKSEPVSAAHITKQEGREDLAHLHILLT